MVNFKKLPIALLEAAAPYVSAKSKLFKIVNKKEKLLYFADTDPESTFYFSVDKLAVRGELFLTIEFKPSTINNLTPITVEIKAKEFSNFFDAWAKMLEAYSRLAEVFKDPILDGFTKEYYESFHLVDEQANELPLETTQILLLDKYLQDLSEELTHHITEVNEDDISEIQNEIGGLRKLLTVSSKADVVGKLSKIWGMVTKQGVSFMKAFLTEAKKQIIQQGFKMIVSHGQTLID